MTIRKIAILSLALLLPLTLEAQKRKKRVVKKPPVEVVEEPEEDPRITNMREMTQQIIIIDSIVTDKDQFLSHYRLSSETGSLTTTSQFFGKNIGGYAFLNEMGNKVYFSKPDNGLLRLYSSDKLGSTWSDDTRLQGLDDGISEADYPFMMNDGITFYFAAKGEESIGGYDIFFTRYDSRNACFLKPENLGMPFNSEANDYMYVIDEQSRIGYFVSDRRQPEDKVCIYIFVPSETRRTYDPSVYTEQQIRDFADITSIADTWGDGSERKAALARLRNISTMQTSSDTQNPNQTAMVINDQLTYSDHSDFKSLEARRLYDQLLNIRQRQEKLNSELEKLRDQYAKGNAAKRDLLRQPILHNEEQLVQLNEIIKSLEKKIRQEENNAIQQQ